MLNWDAIFNIVNSSEGNISYKQLWLWIKQIAIAHKNVPRHEVNFVL